MWIDGSVSLSDIIVSTVCIVFINCILLLYLNEVKFELKFQGVPQSQTAANPTQRGRKKKITKTNMYKALETYRPTPFSF